ncbi:MAG: phenylalanine--tRNA ligase subunit beta, partial [Actinobacteria bacterium]|nr:phenylalanine--tRNA ligase subunit beta [Actinomycetota bacterium]
RRFAAVLLTGSLVAKQPGQAAVPADLADAVDAVRVLAAAAGVDIELVQAQRAALHPGRTARVLVAGTEIGYVGEVLPAVSSAADLPGRVLVAEIDLDALLEAAQTRVVAASLSGYPAATQDVSLVVSVDVPAGEVRAALVEGGAPLLEGARLVDDYRGTGLGEGQKSLTFALRFRAPDRTLTAAEATEAKMAGVARAAERYGAAIRD